MQGQLSVAAQLSSPPHQHDTRASTVAPHYISVTFIRASPCINKEMKSEEEEAEEGEGEASHANEREATRCACLSQD